MHLGVGARPHLVGGIVNQCTCIIYVFRSCVVLDCCMAPDDRWCCQTIFGRRDVTVVIQLLEDGERLRVIARRLGVPPSVVSDYGEVTRRLENAP